MSRRSNGRLRKSGIADPAGARVRGTINNIRCGPATTSSSSLKRAGPAAASRRRRWRRARRRRGRSDRRMGALLQPQPHGAEHQTRPAHDDGRHDRKRNRPCRLAGRQDAVLLHEREGHRAAAHLGRRYVGRRAAAGHDRRRHRDRPGAARLRQGTRDAQRVVEHADVAWASLEPAEQPRRRSCSRHRGRASPPTRTSSRNSSSRIRPTTRSRFTISSSSRRTSNRARNIPRSSSSTAVRCGRCCSGITTATSITCSTQRTSGWRARATWSSRSTTGAASATGGRSVARRTPRLGATRNIRT